MSTEYRVLIIEDEFTIRSFITINLKESGYLVQEASSGEQGLDIADQFQPHIVILDIMLPGLDGYQVCKQLRQKCKDVGLILLSAKRQDMDKIVGLELGADDYMVKPFNPLELLARVRALLRRTTSEKQEIQHMLRFNEFELDLGAKVFRKAERVIELTPKEFSIMQMLMQHPYRAFSRDELLNKVWGENYFGDNKIVDVNIRRLREKIEDDASTPIYIQTVWGYGYRWSGEGQ